MECEKGKGVKDGIKALGTRETGKVELQSTMVGRV